MNQSDAETIGTALADAGFDFIATLPADQLHALAVLGPQEPALHHSRGDQ